MAFRPIKNSAKLLMLGALVLGLPVLGNNAMAEPPSEVGAVRDIVVLAYGTPPGGDRHELALLEPVVSDQRLETGAESGLHVRFLDETDLWLDAESDLVLDQVAYDPEGGTGRFIIELGPGLFRMVTGLLDHQSYSVRTPVAVIGVRGTDFAVSVAANGATRVTVYSGEVTVAPRGGGNATPVSPAETASVVDANASVDVSTSTPAVAPPTLSVDAASDSSATTAPTDSTATTDAAAAAAVADGMASTADSADAASGKSVGLGGSADASSAAASTDGAASDSGATADASTADTSGGKVDATGTASSSVGSAGAAAAADGGGADSTGAGSGGGSSGGSGGGSGGGSAQ